ncbi:hypothetical protein MA16_Dca023584 [Dendrobium catenatum]|uniref:Uncharacterized protein n=1 Tax=Dendrobium catenatum TaxID=906689 RepID=A0A2I0XIK6_9ASPA|nr:hypothetical protein MA16_Dca023584 [Dendrobium catenatum]
MIIALLLFTVIEPNDSRNLNSALNNLSISASGQLQLADKKVTKFQKNITKRGSVPETTVYFTFLAFIDGIDSSVLYWIPLLFFVKLQSYQRRFFGLHYMEAGIKHFFFLFAALFLIIRTMELRF